MIRQAHTRSLITLIIIIAGNTNHSEKHMRNEHQIKHVIPGQGIHSNLKQKGQVSKT